MTRTGIHDILTCAVNAIHESGNTTLAQQLYKVGQTIWSFLPQEGQVIPSCPHHIPELLAHDGNIVCRACESKCNKYMPF